MRRATPFLLLLLLTGCSPSPVFRLTAQDHGARWLQGQQLVRREARGVITVVSFERTLGGYLVFDVAVTNRSDSTFLVDPRDFAYTIEGERIRPRLRGRVVAAVDPEDALDRVDQLISSENASAQTNAGFAAVGGLLGVIADLTFDDEKPECKDGHDGHDGDEHHDDAEPARERAEHEMAVRKLTELRDYWAARSLRLTHVGPGQSVGGKVAFPSATLATIVGDVPTEPGASDLRSAAPPPDSTVVVLLRGRTWTDEPMRFSVRRLF